jgi:hypothetical protein
VTSWRRLVTVEPDLASAGRALLYQHGVGLAFLGTVRLDGGPRVHPICPVLTDEALFAFILPSLKQSDLRRDGRYSLHSFPCEDNEDAFCVIGRAAVVEDEKMRVAVSAQFVAERVEFRVPPPDDGDLLFEFGIESCLLTRTTGHGDVSPVHRVWRPPQ